MSISFENQVAIVTGGARGLGRAYAEALAARGARVVIADLGGEGATTAAQIRATGGAAEAHEVDVSDFDAVSAMVDRVLDAHGRIDIALNNAGILRDKTFAKMALDDFRRVVEVHLMGSVNLCKAVWQPMRDCGYGRILLTSSSSGLYGNFGQSNYGAAKAAMLGLMNCLQLEGERDGIRVNMILPSAATRMTDGLLDPEAARLLAPERVAAGALFLVSGAAPSRFAMAAGAGTFARVHVTEGEGIHLPDDELTPEAVAARFDAICDPAGARAVENAFDQAGKLAARAVRAGAA
ncbi:SDR family NAD(P)-dependent oxidoreductase [Marivibrio halodurans]|uniref:SDR family NAD(P)-dependent oxidoreductase n=1 Tax=Marivibrio halodurans TaxID=2039722 RepID=A0A8J7RX91_9PROT|nr:SDR family NAD(P)-dependent oxidoreductase [Marivibrio halodurans]MBP5856220.1 SDR family NAD(P)-dependent oxidoreductase [Marivibrio halodurans]